MPNSRTTDSTTSISSNSTKGASKPDLSKLRDSWPSSYVSRDKVSEFSGGMINARNLANLDSVGKGPAGRFRVGGKKIAYPVDSLITWLEGRCRMVED